MSVLPGGVLLVVVVDEGGGEEALGLPKLKHVLVSAFEQCFVRAAVVVSPVDA